VIARARGEKPQGSKGRFAAFFVGVAFRARGAVGENRFVEHGVEAVERFAARR
jgi:hypothetical protein